MQEINFLMGLRKTKRIMHYVWNNWTRTRKMLWMNFHIFQYFQRYKNKIIFTSRWKSQIGIWKHINLSTFIRENCVLSAYFTLALHIIFIMTCKKRYRSDTMKNYEGDTWIFRVSVSYEWSPLVLAKRSQAQYLSSLAPKSRFSIVECQTIDVHALNERWIWLDKSLK